MTAPGPFGDVAAETIEHLNDQHDDTVTFLARTLCGIDHVESARLTLIDHDGLAFGVRCATGSVEARAAFADRADTPEAAYREFLALLGEARRRADGVELTSLERELTGDVVPTHITTVSAVADLNPRLRQITVAGGLDRYVPLAADQFVYVLAPPAGRAELTIDESFTWEQYEQLPEHERPIGAYYTVRRWQPDAETIDLWVVMHGHDGDGERWAGDARPGDAVALWGPRQAYLPPAGTDTFLLLGDETALPAIAAILEQLDAGQRATVIVTLAPGAEPIELASSAEVDLRWVRAESLLHAMNELGALAPDTYVWGGAESHDITAIRRYVRDVVGLPRSQVSLTGYWRR